MVESLASLMSAFANMGQLLIAGFLAWIAYRKFLKEEHIAASDDRLEVFSTDKQTTELRVTEHGLELWLHDIRPGRGGLQWTLSPVEIGKIRREGDIKVEPESKYQACGVFSIGSKKRW